MTKIEFETPTLNAEGEVLTWTRNAVGQFTEVLSDVIDQGGL